MSTESEKKFVCFRDAVLYKVVENTMDHLGKRYESTNTNE